MTTDSRQPPPPAPPADPAPPHTAMGLYLLALYMILLVAFVGLLFRAPGQLRSDTLPLPRDRELYLFGSNLAMLYAIALLFLPMLFAFWFVNPDRSRRS